MKKMFISTLVLVFAMASVAAATTTIGPASSSTLVPGFATSAQVTLIGDGDTAGYNVSAGHLQGDATYTSSSANSNIIQGTKTAGTAITAIPSGAAAGAAYTIGGTTSAAQ